MPMEITGKSDIDITRYKNDGCENPIFKSREEMKQSLSRFCYGNLHVIGSLWVEALKSVLVGKKMCIIPTVEAAPKNEKTCKSKPPWMRYKDLPLYEKPHYEYKTHQEEQQLKCLGKNQKILQSMLQPMVTRWREGFGSAGCGFSCFVSECICEIGQELSHQVRCFKCCMRSGENYEMRTAVVAAATAAGFLIGRRKSPLITVRLFYTTVGALASGALCFPKETDEYFRAACYELDKVFLVLYNFYTGSMKMMPTIGPCEKDKPAVPPKRAANKIQTVCPKPKPPPKPKKKPPPPPPKKKKE